MVHWAGVRRTFEFRPHIGRYPLGKVQRQRQLSNAPRRIIHMLFDTEGTSAQVDLAALSYYPHNGKHTGSKRRPDEIGWRKRGAIAIIVLWGSRDDLGPRWSMRNLYLLVSEVSSLHWDHILPFHRYGRCQQD